ncbi:hypothetical protein Tco_0180144 [Tanacetum coccineum]
MFDRAFKRVNTFEDFRTELVEGKEKRAGTKLVQKSTKKQKVEDDKETTELKQRMEIIPDEEEVAIDAIPLASKSPSIVGWKIQKRMKKYLSIMRSVGKSLYMYMIFSYMHKSFDREDLENLYKLVKSKYESTRPVEDLDLLLWGDLKTMFEPHVEDKIYMLVEKKYPLTLSTLTMMLEKKLMIDYETEYMIIASAENRPPMLDKTMYNSWQSCMLLYLKGKKNGRMMLESIENGPLVYLTIEENGQVRNKKYAELTEQEKLQDDCDFQDSTLFFKVSCQMCMLLSTTARLLKIFKIESSCSCKAQNSHIKNVNVNCIMNSTSLLQSREVNSLLSLLLYAFSTFN